MISVKNHHIPATILVDIALNIHTDYFKYRLQIIKNLKLLWLKFYL